jgi:hypothetical protein
MSVAKTPPSAEAVLPPACAAQYPWIVAVLLAFAYAVAFIDRQILNLLVDPIKKTLLLTDTALACYRDLPS